MDVLTIRTAAAMLSLSTATVYKLCRSGGLPHARVLNSIRIFRTDLLAYLGQRSR